MARVKDFSWLASSRFMASASSTVTPPKVTSICRGQAAASGRGKVSIAQGRLSAYSVSPQRTPANGCRGGTGAPHKSRQRRNLLL